MVKIRKNSGEHKMERSEDSNSNREEHSLEDGKKKLALNVLTKMKRQNGLRTKVSTISQDLYL